MCVLIVGSSRGGGVDSGLVSREGGAASGLENGSEFGFFSLMDKSSLFGDWGDDGLAFWPKTVGRLTDSRSQTGCDFGLESESFKSDFGLSTEVSVFFLFCNDFWFFLVFMWAWWPIFSKACIFGGIVG